MKRNFQRQMESMLEARKKDRPRLLLHCCCGPCSTYVLECLCRYFDVTALFYNPNIYPLSEYEKRLFWLGSVIEKYGGNVEIAQCDHVPEAFDKSTRGLEDEPEGGARCKACFRLRLSETALRASREDFDYFCTTLTVSPHKDAESINDIGLELERQHGVLWLASDFKKGDGYKRSIELSKEYGLYRQEYCGCEFSIRIKEVEH